MENTILEFLWVAAVLGSRKTRPAKTDPFWVDLNNLWIYLKSPAFPMTAPWALK